MKDNRVEQKNEVGWDANIEQEQNMFLQFSKLNWMTLSAWNFYLWLVTGDLQNK
jgi:hypothetical protein